MSDIEITVDLSQLPIDQLLENELETIRQTDISFDPWPGRMPLDIDAIENERYQDPEDTIDHILNCVPRRVRLGGK